jgi:hypothetical protein
VKRQRYSEEQIIGILKEAEAGVPLADLVRKHGISPVRHAHSSAIACASCPRTREKQQVVRPVHNRRWHCPKTCALPRLLLQESGNPRLSSLGLIIEALGLRLSIESPEDGPRAA